MTSISSFLHLTTLPQPVTLLISNERVIFTLPSRY